MKNDQAWAKIQMTPKEKVFFELLEAIHEQLMIINEQTKKGSEVRASPS